MATPRFTGGETYEPSGRSKACFKAESWPPAARIGVSFGSASLKAPPRLAIRKNVREVRLRLTEKGSVLDISNSKKFTCVSMRRDAQNSSASEKGSVLGISNSKKSSCFSMRRDAQNSSASWLTPRARRCLVYYAGGLLNTEDGPWASDTVTNSYNNARLRSGLTLQQPTGSCKRVSS